MPLRKIRGRSLPRTRTPPSRWRMTPANAPLLDPDDPDDDDNYVLARSIRMFGKPNKRRGAPKFNNFTLRKQPPLRPLKSLYGLTLEREGYPVPPLGVPPGMEILINTDHLIMRVSSEFSFRHYNRNYNNFEILDSRNLRILFAIDVMSIIKRSLACDLAQDFTYSFLDRAGRERFVLSGESNWWGFGSPVIKLLHGEKLLGRVIRSGKLENTIFRVQTQSGRVSYVAVPIKSWKHRGQPCWFTRNTYKAYRDWDEPLPQEFDIWSADRTVHIGRITDDWNKYYHGCETNNVYRTADSSIHRQFNDGYPNREIDWLIKRTYGYEEFYGVSFPIDLSPTSRALLLGIVVHLKLQLAEEGRRRFRNQLQKNHLVFIKVIIWLGCIAGFYYAYIRYFITHDLV